MALTVDDLKPKPFTVNVRGIELECSPLRVSHALIVAKVGKVLQNAENATKDEIKEAETDLDELIGELVPQLKDIHLDLGSTMELLQQMMDSFATADAKAINEAGVEVPVDPKA